MSERNMHLIGWEREDEEHATLILGSDTVRAVVGFMDDLNERGWHYDAEKNRFVHESEADATRGRG